MSRRARVWVLVGLVAPFTLVTLAGSFRVNGTETLDPGFEIPMRLGIWEGFDVTLSRRTIELLGTDRVIQRRYRNASGGEVLVCLVRAGGARRSIHPPEVCYRGWGYETTGREDITLDPQGSDGRGIPATLLELDRDRGRRIAVFWYQSSGRFRRSYLAHQARITLARLFGARVDGALVRISTPLEADEQPDSGRRRVREFVASIYPYLASPSR